MRTLILVLVSFAAFAQSPKKIKEETISVETYLITGFDQMKVFCGLTKVDFFHSNKRVILRSPEISLDLKITERKSEQWKGTDLITSEEYYLRGLIIEGEFGLIIVPVNQEKGLLGVIMTKANVCD